MTATQRAISIAIVLALTGLPSAIRADDVSGAAKAFAQAQEVMLAGDVARAADLYELADELAPSAPAVRNAARARLAVGHLAVAATHAAELLRRYPSDREARTIAEAILSKVAPQLARIDVTCSTSCTLSVDGKAVSSVAREQYAFFTQPGARTVVAMFDGERKRTKQVTALVNKTTTIELEAPPEPVEPAAVTATPAETVVARTVPAPPVQRRGKGISRLWVLGGTVVTLGLGTTAALSGMATLDTRDEIRELVDSGSESAAIELYNKGRDQQIRTNILLGATAVVGVTTIVLAVVTNWSGDPEPAKDVAIVPTGDGVSVVYGARF